MDIHAVLRETFLFALQPSDQPANPVPRFLELMRDIEAAREAELDALQAWWECVGDAE